MKIGNRRILEFTIAAFVIVAAKYSAQAADTIVLDPDGSGNSPKINNLNTFQFGAGNSLYQGAIPFTAGATFQLLFQAQLNSVVTSSGTQVTPIGLNATGATGGVLPFELTVVGSVTETVITVDTTNPPRATYKVTGTQGSNSFVEVYYDGAQNANPLQGTGYNDGKLILRGAPLPPAPDVGTFALTQPQPVTPSNFDLFGTNDYATAGTGSTNITSITGVGATRLDVTITFVDPAFFVAAATGDPGRQLRIGDIVSLDISHSTPFDKVDPSRKFVAAANTGTAAGPTPAATPRVGSNNGTSGPDLQMQSLLAASVRPATTPSPTPTPSGTPTPTPSATPTPTPSATPTPTATPTPAGRRVVVAASVTQVTEGQDATITFSVKPIGSHPALTVNYSVGGNATLNTDYTLSGTPGQVPIPANADSASITLHSLTDTVKEPNGEAAKIFVQAGTGYGVPTQLDAKRASVIIVDPTP